MGPVLTEMTRKELSISENEVYEISVLTIQGQHGKTGMVIIAHDISRENR